MSIWGRVRDRASDAVQGAGEQVSDTIDELQDAASDQNESSGQSDASGSSSGSSSSESSSSSQPDGSQPDQQGPASRVIDAVRETAEPITDPLSEAAQDAAGAAESASEQVSETGSEAVSRSASNETIEQAQEVATDVARAAAQSDPADAGQRIEVSSQEVARLERNEPISTVDEQRIRSDLREFAANSGDLDQSDVTVRRSDSGAYQAVAGGSVVAQTSDPRASIESQLEEQTGADITVERQDGEFRATFANPSEQAEYLEQQVSAGYQDITREQVTVEQQGNEFVANLTGEGVVRVSDPDQIRSELSTDPGDQRSDAAQSMTGGAVQQQAPGFDRDDFIVNTGSGEVYLREGAEEDLVRERAAFEWGVDPEQVSIERQDGEFVASAEVPAEDTIDLSPQSDSSGINNESAGLEQIERAQEVRERGAASQLSREIGQFREQAEQQLRSDFEGGVESAQNRIDSVRDSVSPGSTQQAALTAAAAGVATPEPVSTGTGLAVGGLVAGGLALDAARRSEFELPTEQDQPEIEAPTEERSAEFEAPSDTDLGGAEVGVGETMVSSELEATDQMVQQSEVSVPSQPEQPTSGESVPTIEAAGQYTGQITIGELGEQEQEDDILIPAEDIAGTDPEGSVDVEEQIQDQSQDELTAIQEGLGSTAEAEREAQQDLLDDAEPEMFGGGTAGEAIWEDAETLERVYEPVEVEEELEEQTVQETVERIQEAQQSEVLAEETVVGQGEASEVAEETTTLEETVLSSEPNTEVIEEPAVGQGSQTAPLPGQDQDESTAADELEEVLSEEDVAVETALESVLDQEMAAETATPQAYENVYEAVTETGYSYEYLYGGGSDGSRRRRPPSLDLMFPGASGSDDSPLSASVDDSLWSTSISTAEEAGFDFGGGALEEESQPAEEMFESNAADLEADDDWLAEWSGQANENVDDPFEEWY
ncbi:hypothetical protein SAMN06269185_1068 [Natronoarchaeum philippinense]|uniref:Uncharacterized protein n=1 Tax=Natronoarchaeum philippinense TaxID=558529 RepID=A0A285N9L3_NATPI|nr:hypothetical protein [Natronoarchaeum philippinense]SNZ06155.1 hypothetical protein SAMN06269185_1068 [Natronoarchaeum philippinense]